WSPVYAAGAQNQQLDELERQAQEAVSLTGASCWSAATRPDTRPCGCSAKPYTVTESARSPGSKAGRDGADHGAVQTPRARPLIAEDLHLQRQGIVLRGVVQLI